VSGWSDNFVQAGTSGVELFALIADYGALRGTNLKLRKGLSALFNLYDFIDRWHIWW